MVKREGVRRLVDLDETVTVTWAVTRAVLPGKRKQVGNQQVRMIPAKFLRPWEVIELDIPEIDQ